MAFLRWCEKSAGCGGALPGLQKNNPTEWHGSAAGQLRANTARTTPLWHSLNDACPETTSKDKNASRGLQR